MSCFCPLPNMWKAQHSIRFSFWTALFHWCSWWTYCNGRLGAGAWTGCNAPVITRNCEEGVSQLTHEGSDVVKGRVSVWKPQRAACDTHCAHLSAGMPSVLLLCLLCMASRPPSSRVPALQKKQTIRKHQRQFAEVVNQKSNLEGKHDVPNDIDNLPEWIRLFPFQFVLLLLNWKDLIISVLLKRCTDRLRPNAKYFLYDVFGGTY